MLIIKHIPPNRIKLNQDKKTAARKDPMTENGVSSIKTIIKTGRLKRITGSYTRMK